MSDRVEWKTSGKGGKCERSDNIYVKYLKPAGNHFDDILFLLYDNDDASSKDAALKGILMVRDTQALGFKKGTVIMPGVNGHSNPHEGFILHAKKSEIHRAEVHIQSRSGHAVGKATAMEFFLSASRRVSLIPDDETFGGLAMILNWNNIKVGAKDPSFKLKFWTESKSDLPGLDRVNLLISKKSKYLVARTVAKGGFGKLHLALDTKSKQMHAVKVFSTYKKTVSKTSKEDLNSELNLQRDFQPKIKIYDQFEISSPGSDFEGSPFRKYYVVMDIFACSLGEIIVMLPPQQEVFNPQGRKMRWTPAKLTAKEIFDLKHYIFAEVAKDVQRLHAKNYRHGDIKDPNVLVSYSGDVALSDYGSARKDPERTFGTDGWYPGAESGRGFEGDIGALSMLFLRIHCLLKVKSYTPLPPYYCTINIFGQLDDLLEKERKKLKKSRIDAFIPQLQGMLSSGRKTIITSDSSASVKTERKQLSAIATLERYDSMRKTTIEYQSELLKKKGISTAYKAAHEDLARYLFFSGKIYKEDVKIGEMIKLVNAVGKHIDESKSKANLARLAKSVATDLQKYRKALSDAGRFAANK
ncbi:protein kinase [Thermodesulfobacteriota bacterium]